MAVTNPALETPYLKLVCNPYEHHTSVNTRVTFEVMQKDLTRDDMVQVCEDFMKAIGYTFSSKECLDIMVTDT